MGSREKINIWLKDKNDTGAQALAQKISSLTGLSVFSCCPYADMALVVDADGIGLCSCDEPTAVVRSDFIGGAFGYRRTTAGGSHELLLKVMAGSESVFDATAGLGRDSFLLALGEKQVIAAENNLIMHTLFDDGLRRAKEDKEVVGIVKRISLLKADSHGLMEEMAGKVDSVYLDPMFPMRKKSAAVKKEMKLTQMLLGETDDGSELLRAALDCKFRKIVVKRPAKAECLGKVKPSRQVKGKAVRFDIWQN